MEERKKVRVSRSMNPVAKEDAVLEAEKGETILTDTSGEGIPEFYEIKGKPHSQGGTPLSKYQAVPGSFIFSKHKSMKIKDPKILKDLGYANPIKGGYSPAEISKKFDFSKSREILVDEMSDKISIETAEKMIANSILKLGLIAMVQESAKGFPTGIPKIAQAYLESSGIDVEALNQSIEGGGEQQQPQPQGQQQPQPQQQQQPEMSFRDGGQPLLRKFEGGGDPASEKLRKRKLQYLKVAKLGI